MAPRSSFLSTPSASTNNLENFKKQFLQGQDSSSARVVDPFSLYQAPRPFPTFRRLNFPSTEVLYSTLHYIITTLGVLKGVHSSSEWYPDFGDGEITQNVLMYGELRALKGVIGFLHQGGINEKYCWLMEGVDSRLYCVDDEDPEGVFDFGLANGGEGARRIVDDVFGWI